MVLKSCRAALDLLGSCKVLTDLRSACTSCFCVANDAEDLSRFLGATFTALTHLRIDATMEPYGEEDEDGLFPALDVQIGDNVRHLKSLGIGNHAASRGINLDILGSKQLTSLEILTEGELNLNISDVASLAAPLQMFRIRCDTHFSEHAQLQTLRSAIDSLGGKGSDKVCGHYPDLGSGAFLYCLHWIKSDGDVDTVEDQLAACRCNACWECLEKAGVFDPLLM